MSFGDLKVQDLIYEDSSNNEITVVIADLATKANPTFTGTVTVPTAPASDVSTKAASTAFVDAYYATKSGASFTGAVTGTDLTLSGNLVVNGTTTTINTQTLDVEDKNIVIGKVSNPSDTTADGGGWTLKGSSDKTFNWVNSTDAWTSSEHIYLGDNKKLLLGVGVGGVQDLQIYSDGSSGILKAPSGGGIHLGNADTENILDIEPGRVVVNGGLWVENGDFSIRGSGYPKILWDLSDNTLEFSDNIKLNFGAGDDMRLYSDGTNGYVQGDELRIGTASNTTNAVFTNTKFDFRKDVDLTNSAKLGIGGSYGSSGHVLTSGGSGAAPSWAAVPPGGNTFTAVANGSIANNKAVKIDTDGKVSEIKVAQSTATALSFPGSAQEFVAGEQHEYIKVVNCGEDKVLALYQRTSGTFQVNCQVGYHASSSATKPSWGTVAHINNDTGSNRISDGVDMVYIGSNRVIIAFRLNGPIKVYMATVNTSNNTVSFSGSATVGSNAAYPCISYDPDNDSVLCCFSDLGANGRGKGVVITWSGTSLSTNSYVEFPRVGGNMSVSRMTSTYDTNDNRHIVAFNYNDYGDRGYVVPVSVSGTTPTFGSLVQFCGSGTSTDNLHASNELDMAFDDNENRFVIFYTAGSRCWKHAGSCSSGTVSITPSDQSMSLYTHGNADIYPSIVFEPITNTFVAAAVTSAGGNFNRYAQNAFFSLNTNANTFNLNTSNALLNNATMYTSVAHWGRTTEGRILNAYQEYYSSAGSRLGVTIDALTTAATSNLTDAEAFVGFADQAYTNGQTATIKTYGNNVDTLSGMTIGSQYYVQGNGSLATTVDSTLSLGSNRPLAGLAISASKLLIRDPLAKA
tara:strand:+ start:800 stop:3361 length:2562 start_codon:yes stop_codon:yes gene_type:complete